MIMPKNATDSSADVQHASQRSHQLTRVSANLTPRSLAALQAAVALTGDTQTDTINRALQVYAHLEKVISRGGEVITRQDGQDTSLQFI
jgi:hypothetical protein